MLDGTLSPPCEGGSEQNEGSFAQQTRVHKEFYAAFGKRVLDIVLVVLSLPLTLPVIVLVALLIGRSPFYTQSRIGRNGRTFRLWKLRSMVRDADKALDIYLAQDPARRTEWDLHQKLDQDPRITRVGHFIRKTSLDELPQLWNVIRGDMSLVGPRPMMLGQQALYPGSAYYRLRPGLTGSWQVSDRNAVSFSARAQFDEDYYHSLSFRKDTGIILQTVRIVLRATGK